MSLVLEIWQVLTSRQKRYTLAALVLAGLMAFSTVIGIAAIAPFFAVLGDPGLIDSHPILRWLYSQGGFTDARSLIVALGLAFIALVLAANLINLAGFMAMNRLALWIGDELQNTLFAEYLDRPYLFHVRTRSATLFNNIVNETSRVTQGILRNAFALVTNIVTAVFIVATILLLNPLVSLAMIALLAGGYLLIYLTMRDRLLRLGETQTRSVIEQTKIVNESFGAIKEIIVLRARDFFRARFERASKAVSLTVAHTHVVGQSPKHIMECVAVAGLVGLALLLSGRGGRAGPWLGQLTFVAFGAYRLLPMLQQAFAAVVKIRAERAAFAVIAPDLRQARAHRASGAPTGPADPVGLCASWRDRPNQEIRLRNVRFRYAPDRPWVLDGISLCIPARAAVGLIGANGSGKTTLMDVIAGLLPPVSGELEVDGIRIEDRERPAWQSRIAYVPQSIFLRDASLAENIALGVAPEAIDPRRLEEAVRLAQLDEVVSRLPAGLHHVIGERGVELSGGQRQRIGIARALYQDAAVLLLDEATNALDGLTEQELIATLSGLRGRYTIVLIAHRLSSVRLCDRIFEVANGKIAASGTCEELMRRSEAFRRMAGAH